MKAGSIPSKFTIPFASGAGTGFIRPIPAASQIGIQNGAASLIDGFPPANFLSEGAGGTPPFGQDFNGLLNQITAWTQWQSAGGAVPYDAAFQLAIGGYPYGAIIESAAKPGTFWICGTDDNMSDPDAGGANWSAWPSTSAVVAAGGIANVQMFMSTTRVPMTGNAGNGYLVTPWNGTYVKQYASSKIIAWYAAPSYSPGVTGATGATLTVGGTSIQQAASNSTSADARGQSVINGLFSGKPAGVVNWSASYARFDSLGWTGVFCPNQTDHGQLPPQTTATIIFGEIK